MSARLLCGVPIQLGGEVSTAWGLPATDAPPRYHVRSSEVAALPAERGQRLFEGPGFSVREADGTLWLTLRDAAAPPCLWAALQPSERWIEIQALPDLCAAERSLRDALLPELIVTHLWPFEGRSYLHASGTCADGGVRLFLGTSGRGKSTAASLLVEAGERPFCADRCAALASPPEVAAAPWHGGQVGDGAAERLRELFVLERGTPCRQRLRGGAALAALCANAFLPRWWPKGLARALENLAALAEAVPVHRLASEPDRRLVQRVREAA